MRAPGRSRDTQPSRVVVLLVATSLIGAVFTAIVTAVPSIDLAYRSPPLHVSITTAAALVGLSGAYLVCGRFHAGARLDDLLLAAGLAVLAAGNLSRLVRDVLLPGDAGSRLSVWTGIAVSLVASGCIAAAPFVSRLTFARPRIAAIRVAAGATVLLVAAATLVALLGSRLPAAGRAGFSPETSNRIVLPGNPIVLAVELAAILAFAAAAAGFARRSLQNGDEFLGWVAGGAILAAFARLNYLLFPSANSEWVYTGDVLRLGFYVVLLVGVARETRDYWAQLIVLEERRRLAHDLHDGVVQELAFVSRELRARGDDRLASTAERALDESRQAIAALTQATDEPVDRALARAAEEAAARFGVSVRLQLQPGIELSQERRTALVRILREAVSNAARHSGARLVDVTLTGDVNKRLIVEDDGAGFEPAKPTSGFGLVTMRERAEAEGATMTIRSRLGFGTTVEVVLP